MSTSDRASFHYDSLNSANRRHGEAISKKLGQLLGKNLAFQDLEDSPQQANSSDCGVFVCLTMRHVLESRLLKRKRGEKVSMSMGGREVDAASGRKMMLRLLEDQRRTALGQERERERRSG